MNTRYLTTFLAQTALSFGLLGAASSIWATDNFTATTGSEKATKAKKPKQPKIPIDKGSAENKSERDKRLLRECRGKANAGACEGYAN